MWSHYVSPLKSLEKLEKLRFSEDSQKIDLRIYKLNYRELPLTVNGYYLSFLESSRL